jgi:RNA polymerase sigma factor (sigma-70 family)
MTDDGQLLRQYLEERSEAAFTELVRRHVNVVYFAALRRVGGDRHLAHDVAQSVFADLARKAPTLKDRPVLIGWLYTSTRFAAAQAVRTEQRRRTHEQEAQIMHELNSTPESNWNQLRPVIDDAMDELNEQEREIVLLRYFEQLPLADVGARFAISTDAARMRVDRALEKLRGLLARRGIASTASILAAGVASQSALAVPPGIVPKIVGSVLHRTGASAAATLGVGKIVLGLVTAGVAIAVVLYRARPPTVAPAPPATENAPASSTVAPLPAGDSSPPDAADRPPAAAPAEATPSRVSARAVGPAGGFGGLGAPAEAILKNLWSLQETSGRRWAMGMGPNAPNFAVFSAGRDALLAAGLLAAKSNEAVHLTSAGVAFCQAHQAEIDAYPAFYPGSADQNFGDLTAVERDILKALWSMQEEAGGVQAPRRGLVVPPAGANYGVYTQGSDLLIARHLVARGNKGGVHLTDLGLAFCRRQQDEIESYPAFYHPAPGPAN